MVSNETMQPLVSEREAARRLGVSYQALRSWRRGGKGPPHIRLGVMVKYRWKDIDEWVNTRVVKGSDVDGNNRKTA